MTRVLCDLDGVIYRGEVALPGAAAALQRLAGSGVDVVFVTNNSTRTPASAAEKISRLTGVAVGPEQVITSSIAAASILTPSDDPVLVVGEEGVLAAIDGAGLEVTTDAMSARSVVVGLTRDLSYELLASAMGAIRSGARFIATNDDPTYPTEDGLVPGSGAIVAAIAAASGQTPEVAGKPNPAMKTLIRRRVGAHAWVIGDRLDTDIALTEGEPGWCSILVLTGVTEAGAAGSEAAQHVVASLTDAVDLVLGGDNPS